MAKKYELHVKYSFEDYDEFCDDFIVMENHAVVLATANLNAIKQKLNEIVNHYRKATEEAEGKAEGYYNIYYDADRLTLHIDNYTSYDYETEDYYVLVID